MNPCQIRGHGALKAPRLLPSREDGSTSAQTWLRNNVRFDTHRGAHQLPTATTHDNSGLIDSCFYGLETVQAKTLKHAVPLVFL